MVVVLRHLGREDVKIAPKEHEDHILSGKVAHINRCTKGSPSYCLQSSSKTEDRPRVRVWGWLTPPECRVAPSINPFRRWVPQTNAAQQSLSEETATFMESHSKSLCNPVPCGSFEARKQRQTKLKRHPILHA